VLSIVTLNVNFIFKKMSFDITGEKGIVSSTSKR